VGVLVGARELFELGFELYIGWFRRTKGHEGVLPSNTADDGRLICFLPSDGGGSGISWGARGGERARRGRFCWDESEGS
jgi:hypothetical protein